MLPLTDTVKPARMPWVTLALIAASVLFWLAYQLPAGLFESVDEVGFRACSVPGDCVEDTLPWVVTATLSMFAHGGWAHLVGNMVFLLAFGPRVEDRLGRARFLLLYVVAGYVATALQGAVALQWMSSDDTNVPGIGASGAISGVVGAYLVLFPFARVVVYVLPAFFLRIPALALLGIWFVLQALAGTWGLAHPEEDDPGIAFFAHVGGFVAGAVLAILMTRVGWHRAGARAGPAGGEAVRV